MQAFFALFHALFGLIAQAIVKLHDYVTGPVLGRDSGASWALAIVLLTVAVRGLMYPLFVKQIKTQRVMAELQPKMKELQKKHKNDKETLNQEMMKLYKEHNANPLAGCLPLLLQMPIFIALFQVLKQLEPNPAKNPPFPEKFGLTRHTIESLQKSKIFGAPIGAGFKSSKKLLEILSATPGPVKIVSVVLIVAMVATTFLTSKQMMAKGPTTDPSQATQQKVLLYVMPAFLGLFGFQVAIGVLIYWTTTNLFSLGQQAVVIRHLGPVGAPAPSTPPAKAKPPAAPPILADPAGTPPTPSPNGAPGRANTPKNTAKRGKGQRRGGRR